MTLRVGLTGGIGSGKSTVARIFEVLGVPVYYADERARRLMQEDPDMKKQLVGAFGAQVYKEGMLDRRYLASQVFSSPEKLRALNAITHPATLEDARRWMLAQQAPYALKEAALIFESGAERLLDVVVGVAAPTPLRVERVASRDHTTAEKVLERMQAQMPEEDKMARCHFVIVNDERRSLLRQVWDLHQKLLAISQKKAFG